MSYSVNANAALHLGDAVPTHLLIGTTKHSCIFLSTKYFRGTNNQKNQFIPSSGSYRFIVLAKTYMKMGKEKDRKLEIGTFNFLISAWLLPRP